MLNRTYKEDLKVTTVDNCLRVTYTFKDINGDEVDYCKHISIEKPISAKILDGFFEDILQEIAWRKMGRLTTILDGSKPANQQ